MSAHKKDYPVVIKMPNSQILVSKYHSPRKVTRAGLGNTQAWENFMVSEVTVFSDMMH